MNIDKTQPVGKWSFDENVTAVFDSMLENSIPSYTAMRDLTFALGKSFVTPNSAIIDLGASLGRAIEPFCPMAKDMGVKLIGYEVSEPMRAALKANDQLTTHGFKLADGSFLDVQSFVEVLSPTKIVVPSVVLSILTIQFTPIEHRRNVMRTIYNSLSSGGAFLFVEKVIGDTAELDNLMVKTYYEMKSDNGYSEEQIKAKRKSLEGVLVPLSAKWNEEMLCAAGFKQVECFYRHLNFAGWIAIKD